MLMLERGILGGGRGGRGDGDGFGGVNCVCVGMLEDCLDS